MPTQPAYTEPKLHSIVEVREGGYKCFPPDTVGWVQEVNHEGSQNLVVIFRHQNDFGSDRHRVIVTRDDFNKHLQITGSSPEFPALAGFFGGW